MPDDRTRRIAELETELLDMRLHREKLETEVRRKRFVAIEELTRLGVSHRRIAKILGVTPQTIARWRGTWTRDTNTNTERNRTPHG